MSKYFIVKNTIKHGPLSFDQLKEFKISKTDLVWKEGNADWIKAGEIPELSELIQPEIPKTPFEKKSEETKTSLKANFVIPIITGLVLGFIALGGWASVQSSIYKNSNSSSTVNSQNSNSSESSYSIAMDKYLAGDFGYRPDRGGIQGNEDYYFRNSEQGISRPFKAILSMFNPKTQFFVGENESAPFVPFILIWIVFCTLVYLLIYGIQISIHRTNN